MINLMGHLKWMKDAALLASAFRGLFNCQNLYIGKGLTKLCNPIQLAPSILTYCYSCDIGGHY